MTYDLWHSLKNVFLHIAAWRWGWSFIVQNGVVQGLFLTFICWSEFLSGHFKSEFKNVVIKTPMGGIHGQICGWVVENLNIQVTHTDNGPHSKVGDALLPVVKLLKWAIIYIFVSYELFIEEKKQDVAKTMCNHHFIEATLT